MDRVHLLARGRPDLLADARKLPRLGRVEREAERARVRDRVSHAAESDVDLHRAEAGYLEHGVEPVRESRPAHCAGGQEAARCGRNGAADRRH